MAAPSLAFLFDGELLFAAPGSAPFFHCGCGSDIGTCGYANLSRMGRLFRTADRPPACGSGATIKVIQPSTRALTVGKLDCATFRLIYSPDINLWSI